MSRLVAALLLVAAPALADTPPEIGDQSIGVAVGAASGGRVTPGGLKISGHYYYQLSDSDWFDGTASFTYGGGNAECFHDRSAQLVCDHGLTDGAAGEITAAVRRIYKARGDFRPFARIGIGAGLVRFSDDKVTGFEIPIHVGGGLRARVTQTIAIVVEGELEVGLGAYTQGLGAEPLFGLALSGGVEFVLP